jgi:hypothetical protein
MSAIGYVYAEAVHELCMIFYEHWDIINLQLVEVMLASRRAPQESD